jgi:hypothetical protein
MKWSFSSLKQFTNCPRQYHEVKVLQRYQQGVTQQMLYGTEVHKALEEYARDKKPLPRNYEKFKPLVDALLEIPGDKYYEYEMALSADKLPCEFASPDVWVRGIADLMVIDEANAFIIDYKTGSNKYPDMKQLKLMALMVFAHFPQVQTVKAGLLFVVHNSFINEEYHRRKSHTYWEAFEPDLKRMEAAYESDWWPMNPTPLCRWCPVKECEFVRI